jgi:hypothetical protein
LVEACLACPVSSSRLRTGLRKAIRTSPPQASFSCALNDYY